LTHYHFCYRAMGRNNWFLVGSLVILLSAAAVSQRDGGCWKSYHSWNKNIVTHYNCTFQCFLVLSTNTFDLNRNLINLTVLSLAQNEIWNVTGDVFHHLKKLVYLNLRGNLISSLDEQVFSNLTSLQLLDLSSNRLSKLPDRLFSSQGSLRRLLLQENKLLTISVQLLTPLKSIKLLTLYENQLVCDCELRLAMIWCKERMLSTGATCQNRESDHIYGWTQLEFDNICSDTPVPSVISDMVGAASCSYVVPLLIFGAVALQLMCFGLFVLYKRRQHPPSVSITREERSVHPDSNSSYSYQYDYIETPNICVKQLPACPIQTFGDLGHVQVDTCHNGPESKKSHRNNEEPVRSEVTSRVSYDLPEYDNPSKMTVSNCNSINRSSFASVIVENCLYSVGGAPTWCSLTCMYCTWIITMYQWVRLLYSDCGYNQHTERLRTCSV
jgi:hypothetical protein